MKAIRYAVITSLAALLAACHSSGGGGEAPPPPATPQTYAVRVIGVETVRSADQLALPVAGLPSSAGGLITVRP